MTTYTQEEYKKIVPIFSYIKQGLLNSSFVVEKIENHIPECNCYKVHIFDIITIYFTTFKEGIFNPIDKLIHKEQTYYLDIECLNLRLFSNESSFTINNYYDKLDELNTLIETRYDKQEVLKRESVIQEKRIKGIGEFVNKLKSYEEDK